MRKVVLGLILILSISSFGQRISDADAFFNGKKYKKAAEIYELLLKKTPRNPSLNYKYGASLFLSGKKQEAISFLQTAAEKDVLEAYQYLGDFYFSQYRFEEAYTSYEKYLFLENLSEKVREKFLEQLSKADLGRRMITHVEDIVIVDSLLVDKKEFFRKYRLNSDAGEIVSTGSFFDQPSKMYLSGHLSERKDRFFYTDSVGVQLDVFVTYKLFDGWSVPQAVSGQVNTSFNEAYPFLMSDGVTLYFSSDRKGSLGGYDIFITRFNQNTNSFLPPENVGMPFNSPYNDYLLAIDERSNIGWFATDRFQAKDKVMIYVFILNEDKKIVIEEDNMYLARLAALQSYKKQARLENNATNMSNVGDNEHYVIPNDSTRFVVNDTLTYYSINDFKSDEARALYQMNMEMDQQIEILSILIENKRSQYTATETEEERRIIAPELLSLELKLNDLQRKKRTLELQIRSIEIKKIQNNLQ